MIIYKQFGFSQIVLSQNDYKLHSISIILFMKNPENYLNHQLNTSSTKSAYLFPKQKRFNHRQKPTTQKYYDLPSTRNRKSCSFGIGDKTNFLIKTASPPPGAYQPMSDFDKQKAKKHAISFGNGRQNVRFGSFFQDGRKKGYIPSPNKYTVVVPLSKVSGKIFGKLPSQIDQLSKARTPGPGTYSCQATNLTHSGSYVLSNYKNNRSPRYHTQQSIGNLQNSRKQIRQLSPTSYEIRQKQIGKSFNSKFKTILARTFGKAQRESLADKSKKFIPGCKYRRFSEFGTLI